MDLSLAERILKAMNAPKKFVLRETLYLKVDENTGDILGWTESEPAKDNGVLLEGSICKIDDSLPPYQAKPGVVYVNYKSSDGEAGPEFLLEELQNLKDLGLIEEIL